MSPRRTKEKLNSAVNTYLMRNDLLAENSPWEIRESPLGGFGIFARRDIPSGEIIFSDFPVILGPRCQAVTPSTCIYCFCGSNLSSCSKKCGLPVCSACQNSQKHVQDCTLIQRIKNGHNLVERSSEITKCLTPLRSLLLSNEDKEIVKCLKHHAGSQHGHEVQILTDNLGFDLEEEEQAFLRFVCSVLDANAFEVGAGDEKNRASLRGLYPLGSLANHRCYPNAYHVFDDRCRMVVRASVFIEKDTEIFHAYCRIIWGTTTRLFHLKNTKHFVCNCKRCLDPTEFGTYTSAILCEKCKGNLIPINPLKNSHWQCEVCKKMVSLNNVAKVLSLVGSVLKCLNDKDFKIMLSFLNGKLTTLLPEHSEVIVEVKYRMIWILGYSEGYLWKDLSLDLLELKMQFCQNVLDLLKKLNVGQCNIRGLLLYEMHLCLQEMNIRKNDNTNGIGCDSCDYLEEAAEILKYSASAPEIMKRKWQTS